MQWKFKPVRGALILTLAGILASCSETSEELAGPQDSADRSELQASRGQLRPGVRLSGQVRSTIWQARGEGFAYLGTMSAPVEGTLAPFAGEDVTSNMVGRARFTELPGSPASAARGNQPSLSGSTGNALWNVLRASGPGRALRVKLGGPTRTLKMPDGRELRMELSPPTNGASNVAAIYVDNKLRQLNFFTYERESSRPMAASLDVVLFRETGGVASLTRHDLTAIDADPLAIHEEALTAATEVEALSGEDCETQIDPTPECLEACEQEWRDFIAAGAALLAAGVAFDAALLACASPAGPLGCPAVVAAASAITAATAWVSSAHHALQECQRQHGGILTGGGGGGPGGNITCHTYFIEVSDDGGATWHVVGTVTGCG